ncbi:cell wall hydrolase [Sphingobium boeckii]|uniref:Spore germination cell wall hydrolase CwlJ-like protein n=1 Tax=Sphingobium boeckii TaxID=1082345 RepID=A0A7W9AE53_9SPHN|nr:cell wall hydrolase [Sphingobium boeckii]MBB5684040.1 spore germination cell wall hydrolase CwlJ-like protein [Sphingobium boeckii]
MSALNAIIRWKKAIVLGALLLGIASGHAGLDAVAERAGQKRAIAPIIAQRYEAQQHFPGSATLYMAEDDAAPAPGVTGTATLPPLPAFATLPSGGDGSVIAAASTVFHGRTALDAARALTCLTAGIYYEAASESDEGQRAVAQVILNRVRHPAFPDSVCGVVYQGSERLSGCQFSFSCDGAMARAPSRAGWARAQRIAAHALAGSVYAPVGLATHYHTFAVRPAWNRSLVMTDAIGAHFFHRWQGYWGTPAAFAQAYSGMEPVPGPKRPVALRAAAIAPDETRPVTIGVTSPAFARIQPEYSTSGEALSGMATGDPDSQIVEKYRDSGTWIGSHSQ